MKVSIIVPVYNSKLYLNKCIESIINQTFKNIEIILIDDGSNDGSEIICDKYSQKYINIKVFHTKNLGVSHARNLGIENSTGDYIQFVDSDDYIKPYMTEKLIKSALKHNSDMVMCGYRIVSKYKKSYSKLVDNKDNYYTKKAFIYKLLEAVNEPYFNSPFNKLYKSKFIKENKILFDKNISLGEDLMFNLEVIKYGNRFSTVKDCLYIYMISNNCSSLIKTKRLDIWKNCKLIFNNYKKLYVDLNYYKNYKTLVNGMLLCQVNTTLNTIFNGKFSKYESNAIFKRILKDKIILSNLYDIKVNNSSLKFILICLKNKWYKILKLKFYIKLLIKKAIDIYYYILGEIKCLYI